MKKAKIGLIGTGWIGSEHGRNILKNGDAELVGIADSNEAGAAAFLKKENYRCQVYGDYKDLLKSDIDAVVIASPNAMHAKMTIDAAKFKKHVYCEKPMAITLHDCKRIREEVEKAGIKYLIGYHRRMNPLYRYVKNLLEEGKLGKPFIVESEYNHYVPGNLDIWSWLGKKDIAGSLFHAGSGHNVDLIRFMCGDIKEVACFKDTFLPRTDQVETEDTAVAMYRFENGAIGKVQCCVGPVLPFNFGFRLFGTKGTVQNNKIWYEDIPRFDEAGHEKDYIRLPESWVPDNVQGGISETWKEHMDHFIDVVSGNVPSMNDVRSAYNTSAAVFAALKSAETGKVVTVTGL